MTSEYIDLDDIQGNIVKGYGRFGYPRARYCFFQFLSPDHGRKFIESLCPLITTGRPWGNGQELPPATTNIAFTYQGLKHLGLPTQSLHEFPQEFSMGMKARAEILGDDGESEAQYWDPIWQHDKHVHMFLSINAQSAPALEQRYDIIRAFLHRYEHGVKQLSGHRNAHSSDVDYQDAAAIIINGEPTPKEHFGFSDGISDPYFKGCGSNPMNVIGAGKPTRKDPTTEAGWEPLETGEFILGYRDEAKEIPQAPKPRLLSFNGTFMVYRKLHQKVGSFNRFVEEQGKHYPQGAEAFSAKLVGRWKDGAPLSLFATQAEADAFMEQLAKAKEAVKEAKSEAEKESANARYTLLRQQLTGFNFNNDLSGARCPMGAHVRRVNPRGSLEFGAKDAFATPGALVNRRRILRRGLPYGVVDDPTSDDGDHGIIFMSLNASIERQFEFVQQQWVNYGNDFKLANEKDPICGNHNGDGMFIMQGESAERPPFFCSKLPRFVTTRGGDYFFIPSLTAIRMIAHGLIDPT